ncbi:MAG: polyphosphate polymerase domain-containing protein [Clostridiales Family XIII bacterium]|nr:polyphosphate polymerase domain-containing protein [Clostridiales Family XIII bacterium]
MFGIFRRVCAGRFATLRRATRAAFEAPRGRRKRTGEKIIATYTEWQRIEKKYLFSTPIAYALRHRLEAVLREDAHNGPEGYIVRSLYFDTVSDADFFDKIEGLEQRRKVRLRVYPPNLRSVKLEFKEKGGVYQRKRSLNISAEDARALIRRDFSVLLRLEHPLAAELFGILSAEVYLPRCIVEYRRRAFLAPGSDTRLTFDSHIRAGEGCLDLFAPVLYLHPALDPSDITLEVKYSHFLFGYIRDTLGEYGKTERSVSKYCLSRQISYVQT